MRRVCVRLFADGGVVGSLAEIWSTVFTTVPSAGGTGPSRSGSSVRRSDRLRRPSPSGRPFRPSNGVPSQVRIPTTTATTRRRPMPSMTTGPSSIF